MDHKTFYFIKNLFYFLIAFLTMASCGSYQYSGYINDGIYQNDASLDQYGVAENNEAKNNENNEYYKSAFNEKVLMYSDNESSDQLFTDVENYKTPENDSIIKNYGPWGEYRTR